MQRIRDTVALQMNEENPHNLSPTQAKALADTVHNNVTYLIENCQLTPAADAELMAATSLLIANDQTGDAIAKRLHALREYVHYFNHPDWSPIPSRPNDITVLHPTSPEDATSRH